VGVLLFGGLLLYLLILLNPNAFWESDEGVDIGYEAEGAVNYQYKSLISNECELTTWRLSVTQLQPAISCT